MKSSAKNAGFNLGAAVAAVLAGHLLVDRHGRRPALKLGTMLFACGGGLQASAMNQLRPGGDFFRFFFLILPAGNLGNIPSGKLTC
jgi:MFS family permease